MAASAKRIGLPAAIGIALAACSTSPDATADGTLKVSAEVADCPVIEHLDVVPLEVVRTGEIDVAGALSSGYPDREWSATAGSFDDSSALRTRYRCDLAGEQILTFTVDPGGPCEDAAQARVTCSFSPTCGDGVLDPGEECDDGNTSPGDGCSKRCLRKPVDAGD
jgi:cysteine-rich repeat protein